MLSKNEPSHSPQTLPRRSFRSRRLQQWKFGCPCSIARVEYMPMLSDRRSWDLAHVLAGAEISSWQPWINVDSPVQHHVRWSLITIPTQL